MSHLLCTLSRIIYFSQDNHPPLVLCLFWRQLAVEHQPSTSPSKELRLGPCPHKCGLSWGPHRHRHATVSQSQEKKRHLGKTSISYPYWGLLHCYDQVSDNNNLIEGMIHCGSLFLRCQPLMGRVAHSKAEHISGKGRSNHQHVAGALLPLPPFTWTTVWVLPQIWLILSEILS